MSKHEPIRLCELAKIQSYYMLMKQMAGELVEFEDRHEFAKEMKDSLDNIINTLDHLSHELINDVFRMKMENQNNEDFTKE